jgi:hypothetical protein
MIIEGEWERVDPSKPKSKSEKEAQPVAVVPANADPPKAEEPQLAAAVEAYFEQSGKADASRTAVAEQQDDAFREKLAGLQEHLRGRETKG